MRLLSLILAAVLCMAAGLVAQTRNQVPQIPKECEDTVTTADMRSCESARYETAQRELRVAYQELMEHLDAGRKEKLRTAQDAWLRYRDANADFQASLAKGGTLAPLIKISSLTEMTRARTIELKKEAMP